MKIKVWVEAMGETREDVIELDLTIEQWSELTEKQREEYVEDWAYNTVQMGYGYGDIVEE